MSLFSKLFGNDKEAEKAAKELLNGLFGNQNPQKKEEKPAEETKPAEEYHRAERSSSPSGFSWGDEMPDEENQYNYKGTYLEYFEMIFNSDFAAYRFERSTIGTRRFIYTFYSGASKVLIVELMPEKCSANKFREDCKKEHVPYTRFYYDHDSWWNTRKYVVTRMNEAMKG